MREIKFRAWRALDDYGSGKMITGDETIAGDILNEALSAGMPIMQYTGLKDIYEADLLEDRRGRTWLVYWAGAIAGFRLEGIGINGEREIAFTMLNEAEEYKVIGNIYENPELLEADHD